MSDLLPCPFCGESSAEVDVGETDAVVRCDCCLCEGPVATIGCGGEDEPEDIDLESAAIEFWNRRKPGVVT